MRQSAAPRKEPVEWIDLVEPLLIRGKERSRLGICRIGLGDLRGLNRKALLGLGEGSINDFEAWMETMNPLAADTEQWVTLLTRVAVDEAGNSPTYNDASRLGPEDFMGVFLATSPLLLSSAPTQSDSE